MDRGVAIRAAAWARVAHVLLAKQAASLDPTTPTSTILLLKAGSTGAERGYFGTTRAGPCCQRVSPQQRSLFASVMPQVCERPQVTSRQVLPPAEGMARAGEGISSGNVVTAAHDKAYVTLEIVQI